MKTLLFCIFFCCPALTVGVFAQSIETFIRAQNIRAMEVRTFLPGKSDQTPRLLNKEQYTYRDDQLIQTNDSGSKTVSWLETDTSTITDTYVSRSNYEYHLQEELIKDYRSPFLGYQDPEKMPHYSLSVTRKLPLKNGKLDYNLWEIPLDPLDDYPYLEKELVEQYVKRMLNLFYHPPKDFITLQLIAVYKSGPAGRMIKTTYEQTNPRYKYYMFSKAEITIPDTSGGYTVLLGKAEHEKERIRVYDKRTYDRHGELLIVHALTPGSKDINYTREYKYNEQGDWIEMKEYLEGQLRKTVERVIQYATP